MVLRMSRRAKSVKTLKALNRPLRKPLALVLLVLLVLTPSAPATRLAKAQGAGSVKGKGALYVYKDLSASLELHITQKLETSVVESWSLNALLNIEPADTANLTISALAKRLILHPEELEMGSYGGINYYKMSCVRVLEGEVSNTTTIVFRAKLYNETEEVSLFIFLAGKRAIGPAASGRGL
jgi:predicted membrane-bound mannosyltransferase